MDVSVNNSSPDGNMNILVHTNVRSITPDILPRPPSLVNVARVPHRRIQKHRPLGKPLALSPLLCPHHFAINQPLDRIWGPLDDVLVKPIGAIEAQIVNLLPAARAGGVEIGLDDGPVLAEELEVDLVLGLVALEGGEVDVEVEAGGVAAGALDVGPKDAVEEAGGGAPPGATAVVEGEGDGVGVGAVVAGLRGVVDGDLLQGLGVVEMRWVDWSCSWARHWRSDQDRSLGVEFDLSKE